MAVKLNQRDAGLCTSFALVCMILGDINSAITALHEVTPLSRLLCEMAELIEQALTISPADQIANELMTRALRSNAEITFDMSPSSSSTVSLDDTDALLSIRRANMAEKSKAEGKRLSSGPEGKLRFDAPFDGFEMDEDLFMDLG